MSLLSSMKSDVDVRKDLFANIVMHHHVRRDRRTHDEGVDCVGTSNDVSQHIVTSKEKYEESSLPGAHDADHVRDMQRARHERDDLCCFVPVHFETLATVCCALFLSLRLHTASDHPSLGLGLRYVTEHLMNILTERAFVCDVKEKFYYIALV